MTRYLVCYPAAAAAMAVLDIVWLRLAVKAVYEPAAGFFAYMTYVLTNMATLKLWPAHLAAIDIAWGTFLTAAAATAGYAAASRFA